MKRLCIVFLLGLIVLACFNPLGQAELLKRDDFLDQKSWWDWARDGNGLAASVGSGVVALTVSSATSSSASGVAVWDGINIYNNCTVTLRAKTLTTMRPGTLGWGLWNYVPPWESYTLSRSDIAWFMKQYDPFNAARTWWGAWTRSSATGLNNFVSLSAVDTSEWHLYRIERYNGSVDFYIDGSLVGHYTDNLPQGLLAFHLWIDNYNYPFDPTQPIVFRAFSQPNALIADFVEIYDDQPGGSQTPAGSVRLKEVANETGNGASRYLWKDYAFQGTGGKTLVIVTARAEDYGAYSDPDNIRVVIDNIDLGWNTSTSFDGNVLHGANTSLVYTGIFAEGTHALRLYGDITPILYDTTVIGSASGDIILSQQLNERAPGGSNYLWKEYPFTCGSDEEVTLFISGSAHENSGNEDRIRIVLDSEDFGWDTVNSFSGNLLYGEAKALTISRNLAKGSHTLRVYADQTPMLHNVIIYGASELSSIYTITASAGSNGSITPSGSVLVNYGGTQTFTIAANTGYAIANVLVDGVSVGAVASYTFSNITAGHTISATFAAATYTITASAGSNGSITPSGSVLVNYGGTQTFTIAANTGYAIANVLVDGVSVGAVASYTFSNITAGHTISATFAAATYTITASAGSNGSITPSGSVLVNYGGTQTFTIAANTGYAIANVLVDGVSVGAVASYTFSNITAGHTISATFAAATYTITASAGSNGSITPSGSVLVNYGGTQTFTIAANTGYAIANVLVDGVSVGAVASYTFSNITAGHTISATFAAATYTITASAGSNGSITPSGSVLVNYGGTQTFTIAANTGYAIANVLVDGVSVGAVASYTFSNITAGHTISATFAAATYTITASAGSNGSITPSGSVLVNYGGTQTFTIAANTGYAIANVLVDGVSVGAVASYTFSNITAGHTISATFAAATYTITASAGSNGSITPSGSVLVNYGGTQTFTIAANTGYAIANVLVDGVSVGAVASYTFSNITAGHTISATFAAATYTITASAGSNGSITPSGSVLVNYGGTQTFTIAANTGYAIANVLVDGVSVGAVASYTFSNITAGHTISATFAAATYTITASAGSNGSITPSGSVLVNYGGTQTFTIAANTGYAIANVLVDGVSVGAVASYTFSNITAGHTISATFAAVSSTVTHVNAVQVTKEIKGFLRRGSAKVQIVDANDAPVQGATVNGRWSGGATDTDRFTTGADGWGSATSNWRFSDATFRFCVTSVTKNGWTYNATANTATCGSTP